MKTIISISFCLLLAPTALQSFDQSKENLQGQWELEHIIAIENNVQRAISGDSLGFELPSKIEIQQEEIVFVRASYTNKAEYNAIVKGSIFCFPICAQWGIVEEKLQLQWGQDMDSPPDDPKIRTVIVTYRRK